MSDPYFGEYWRKRYIDLQRKYALLEELHENLWKEYEKVKYPELEPKNA